MKKGKASLQRKGPPHLMYRMRPLVTKMKTLGECANFSSPWPDFLWQWWQKSRIIIAMKICFEQKSFDRNCFAYSRTYRKYYLYYKSVCYEDYYCWKSYLFFPLPWKTSLTENTIRSGIPLFARLLSKDFSETFFTGFPLMKRASQKSRVDFVIVRTFFLNRP